MLYTRSIVLALTVPLLLLGACTVREKTAREKAGGESGPVAPLAYGWQYACAITNDADDRAMCQERIAQAYLDHGDIDQGLKLGEQIENWRRGVILAEVGAQLAERGETNAAVARTEQAEAIARDIQDWQRDLILARAAKAKALLGREAEVGHTSVFYADNRDYRGEVTAYHALALAREGRLTDGLAALDSLAGSTDFDVTVWRAHGYLLLAKAGHLDGTQITNALKQAWAATDAIGGTRRWEVQLDLVDAAAAMDAGSGLTLAWLGSVSSNVMASTFPSHLTAPLVAKTAIRWGLLGRADEVAACARAADPLIKSLDSIEHPALLAWLGEAWVKQGNLEQGTSYYNQAMEKARQLINRRPRAIACVDLCLSLDRSALREPQVSAGLARLLSEFHAPKG